MTFHSETYFVMKPQEKQTLKIALIGYGRMNRLVAELIQTPPAIKDALSGASNNATTGASGASTNGAASDTTNTVPPFELGVIITSADAVNEIGVIAERLRGHDAAIDFSVGEAVARNAEACAIAGVPLVEGATGWAHEREKVKQVVAEHDAALVYGANFSIGVHLFYQIAALAAALFARFDEYEIFLTEAHHSRKRDAPSGTALRLRDICAENGREEWKAIDIASTRAGHIPGTHTVGFDSAADTITLTHTARTREGFARGALFAARWIQGRRGVFEFGEALREATSEEMNSESRIQNLNQTTGDWHR